MQTYREKLIAKGAIIPNLNLQVQMLMPVRDEDGDLNPSVGPCKEQPWRKNLPRLEMDAAAHQEADIEIRRLLQGEDFSEVYFDDYVGSVERRKVAV